MRFSVALLALALAACDRPPVGRAELAQGSHRLARGLQFVEHAQALGRVLGTPVRWNVALIEGAEHSNAQKAVGAAPLVASQLGGH